MFPVFRPHVRRLLEARGLELTFVDVGARNGVLELGDLAPWTVAYGFEPNAEKYAKLVSGRTDASLLGVVAPPFRRLTYLPYALGDHDGPETLYITRGPGAVGVLEPDVERLREIHWRGRGFERSMGDDILTVVRTETVELRALASVAREHGIRHVDYLKIDVEGYEHQVLTGAGDLLDATGLIRVEVCFIPFRRGQRLFSDVDLLLRRHGFDLLRYELTAGQIGYKERSRAFTIGPTLGFPDPYGQPLSADAIYVNRALRDPERLVAQAAVLIEKGYLDEALFVLRTKVGDVDPALARLLREWPGEPGTRAFEAAVRLYRGLRKLARPRTTLQRWLGWRRLARQGVVRSAE
jgi:FkbM family methyltransferase